MNRIMGAILIVLGVFLILWGYDTYSSPATQLSRSLGGTMPLQVWVGIIAGIMNLFVGYRKFMS